MNKILLAIGLSIALASSVFAQEWSLSYFDELRIGEAFTIDEGEAHSILDVAAVRGEYGDWLDLSLDIGCTDFEGITFHGEKWYYAIHPSVGVSADLKKLANKVPVLQHVTQLIPDWTYVGGGHRWFKRQVSEDNFETQGEWLVKVLVKIELGS